jgi:hypothetical protein
MDFDDPDLGSTLFFPVALGSKSAAEKYYIVSLTK